MSRRANPLLHQAEVESGAATDLHNGRTAPQLERCHGTTPVRPPPKTCQVIGIHRPVIETRPAAVDLVNLLRRREFASVQGSISFASMITSQLIAPTTPSADPSFGYASRSKRMK